MSAENESIRKDFIEGVQEIFTTLFNDGVTEGMNFYYLSDQTTTDVYGENKYKVYKQPILLVCQAHLTPTKGNEDVEEVKDSAEFIVPLKDMQDKEIPITTGTQHLETMRRGIIEFHGVIYQIDNIVPKAYVEDVNLMYRFLCTEIKGMTLDDILIEEPDEPTPEDDESGDDNE